MNSMILGTVPDRELDRLYSTKAAINDSEMRTLIPDDYCAVCTKRCRIRRYIVQSICCINRVCNSCHMEHLKGSTRPYCMHCKTVWSHYNISMWFTPKDCKQILRSRASNYYRMGQSYNEMRQTIAAIIKEQIAPHFSVLKMVRSALSEDVLHYNPFIRMLKGTRNSGRIFDSKRKYTDVQLDCIMDITEDCIGDIVDSYGLLPEGSTRTHRKKYAALSKQLSRAQKSILSTVREMQSIIEDSTLLKCPTCTNRVLDLDTSGLHSIDCPYCSTVLSTADYKIVSTTSLRDRMKEKSKHTETTVCHSVDMFKDICTVRSIDRYICSRIEQI